MSTLNSVFDNIPDWKTVLKYKWLVFDTDAIVDIVYYKADGLLQEMTKLGVTFCYIHPVYTEMLASNDTPKKIKELALIQDNGFAHLPLTPKDFETATNIQRYLASVRCFPSPTDLYQSAKLFNFTGDNTYLLTANIKDYPYPLFERVSYLVLQNDTSSKMLGMLKINQDIVKT